MRSLRWLPLAFVAGLHGFVMFAPYVAVVLAATHAAHCFRRRGVALPVAPVGA